MAEQQRLYIDVRADDWKRLDVIGGRCWLSKDAVAAAVLHWALATIEEHGAEFTFLPLPKEKK